MKIVCRECKREEIVNDELFQEVSKLVKKYKMGQSGFLHLINIMFGDCIDDSKHSFDFDEDSSMEIIKNIIDEEKAKNNKLNIKVICTECKQEQEISDKLFNEVLYMTKELKRKVSKNDYTYFLNTMFGNCLYDKLHSFEFDENSMKTIQELKNK